MNEKSEVRKAATPKKQGPPKTAGSELNEKLHQLELSETPQAVSSAASVVGMPGMSTPSGGLPAFLSQYGVASQSQSQEISLPGSLSASNAPAGSVGSATTVSADSRPKKIRKVSVVSKPLKV